MIAEYDWLIPPILIGVLAVICNIFLGKQVLKRGVIFIDLAMAQVAALGVIVVDFYFHSYAHQSSWVSLLGAWALALIAAAVIMLLESRIKSHLEAMIGLIYVVSACIATLIVSHNPHGMEVAKTLLNGRLLWTDWHDLWPILLITLIVVSVARYKGNWLSGKGFYLLFALVIPPLVLNLGVYLEFAALIVPVLFTATISSKKGRLIAAMILGMSGLLCGFGISVVYDLPIGPSIVIGMIVLALMCQPLYYLFKVLFLNVTGNKT